MFTYERRDRPRRYCLACSPPGSTAALWRRLNPERVTAYNEAAGIAGPAGAQLSAVLAWLVALVAFVLTLAVLIR